MTPQEKWWSNPENRKKQNARRRELYQLNGNTRKQHNVTYGQNNKEKYIHTQLRNRANRRGIEFNLDVEDIILPTHCPVLGCELVLGLGSGKRSPYSYSVDRIDPTKGYTKGNIQIMSVKANLMKNNASVEELQQFASWVNKTYGA